jgi:muconolactone delta-isomerase
MPKLTKQQTTLPENLIAKREAEKKKRDAKRAKQDKTDGKVKAALRKVGRFLADLEIESDWG